MIYNHISLTNCHFFFSSRRRHTRLQGDWSSDVCSSDLNLYALLFAPENSLLRMRAAMSERFGRVSTTAMSAKAVAKAPAEEPKAEERPAKRSEERRVGKEGRSRGSPYH